MSDGAQRAGKGDKPTIGSGWQKSSYSASNGHCVETARLADGCIGVRDSKVTDGPVLRFTPEAWNAFLGELRET